MNNLIKRVNDALDKQKAKLAYFTTKLVQLQQIKKKQVGTIEKIKELSKRLDVAVDNLSVSDYSHTEKELANIQTEYSSYVGGLSDVLDILKPDFSAVQSAYNAQIKIVNDALKDVKNAVSDSLQKSKFVSTMIDTAKQKDDDKKRLDLLAQIDKVLASWKSIIDTRLTPYAHYYTMHLAKYNDLVKQAKSLAYTTNIGDEDYEFPTDLSSLEVVQSLGGSTGATLVRDTKTGLMYVSKSSNGNSAHVENEIAVDNAYRQLGVAVPKCQKYVDANGNVVKLSRYIEGATSLGDLKKKDPKAYAKAVAELKKDFDVDCMFSNFDVLGMSQDNILVDKNGKVWRIDNGGALGFRAQGAKKSPDMYNDGVDGFWSMRTSQINKGVFDDIKSVELLKKANGRDWDKASQNLSQADKNIIKARAKTIKENYIARINDYERNNYIPEVVESVTNHSYNLIKEGFDKECPKQINPPKFGFCRTATKGQGKPNITNSYADTIIKASISINHHVGKDNTPNPTSIKSALALEKDLKDLATKGEPNAQKLLTALEDIKKSQKNGFTTAVPHVNAVDVDTNFGNSGGTSSKYTSLTEHMVDYANRQGMGNAVTRVFSYYKNQGNNSWYPGACKLKVLQLVSRGKLDINNPQLNDPEVFYGEDWQKKNLENAIDYYQKHQKQLFEDIDALNVSKACTGLLLENSDFDNNHRDARQVRVVRGEKPVLEQKYNLKDGVMQKAYPVGVEESFSVHTTINATGGTLYTIRDVDYSRVNMIYFFESPSHGDVFYGDNENEIGCDVSGVPVYVDKRIKKKEDFKKYDADFEKAKKNY